jgi:hypothetical protein
MQFTIRQNQQKAASDRHGPPAARTVKLRGLKVPVLSGSCIVPHYYVSNPLYCCFTKPWPYPRMGFAPPSPSGQLGIMHLYSTDAGIMGIQSMTLGDFGENIYHSLSPSRHAGICPISSFPL